MLSSCPIRLRLANWNRDDVWPAPVSLCLRAPGIVCAGEDRPAIVLLKFSGEQVPIIHTDNNARPNQSQVFQRVFQPRASYRKSLTVCWVPCKRFLLGETDRWVCSRDLLDSNRMHFTEMCQLVPLGSLLALRASIFQRALESRRE